MKAGKVNRSGPADRLNTAVRWSDISSVFAALRLLSPIATDPPQEIQRLLMRRYVSVASANLPLSLILFGVVLASFGREAPFFVLIAIWLATGIGYGLRQRLRSRTMRRLEVHGGVPRSADRWFEWLPRISAVAWSLAPLLLSPWASNSNLVCMSYAAVGVLAMTAVSNVAALPACFVFVTSNGLLILCFFLRQHSVQTLTLSMLVVLTIVTLLRRVVGLHRTLIQALVSEQENARLIKDLQLHRDALAIENKTLGRSLLDASDAAQHDPLTGLPNRRYLGKWLSAVEHRISSGDERIAICIVDVDHFKLVNDRFGHPAGDQVLRQLAKLLKGQVREVDCLSRLGGEEFLVVLRNCDLRQARRVAENIRVHVADSPIKIQEHSIEVTVSVGTADWKPGETFEEAYARADCALYRAKNGGRDKVIVDGLASRPAELSDFMVSGLMH